MFLFYFFYHFMHLGVGRFVNVEQQNSALYVYFYYLVKYFFSIKVYIKILPYILKPVSISA